MTIGELAAWRAAPNSRRTLDMLCCGAAQVGQRRIWTPPASATRGPDGSFVRSPVYHTKPDARLLKPFALRDLVVLTPHHTARAAVGAQHNAPHGLVGVAAFADEPARYGLTPKALVVALRDLWVAPGAISSLADEITSRVQTAIVKEQRLRARAIWNEREGRSLFRLHVLGLNAPD